MKHKLMIYFSLFLILTVISCSDNPATVDETGKISGKVIDSKTLEPIVNAYITSNPPSESVLSDNNGYFKIFSVSPGPYKLIASKPGYVSSFTSVTVQKGVSVQAVILLKNVDSLNLPPESPTIVAPENNSVVNTNSANLSWNCYDPDDNTLLYTVMLGNSANSMAIVATRISEAQFHLIELGNGKDYYWQIKAEDPSGANSLSEVFKFSVKY